jgi:RNA polymerase sigma-70 factor, ECF subfamily
MLFVATATATVPAPMGTALTGRDSSAEEPSSQIERAITKGDYHTALAGCTRHFGRALGRLCMAFTGSQAEAEELVQETLLATHQSFAEFRGEGTIRAYVFGIARRKCARYLETRARRTSRLKLVHELQAPDSSEDVHKQMLTKQRAEQARSALETLRPSEREALLLRYQAELSFREVGLAAGCDEATARKRVSRAIARLKQAVLDQEQGLP